MIEQGPPAEPVIELGETRGLYDDLITALSGLNKDGSAVTEPNAEVEIPVGTFSRGEGDSLQRITVDACPTARAPWIEVSVQGADGFSQTAKVRTHPENAAARDPLRRDPLVTYVKQHEGAPRPSVDEWNTRAAVAGTRMVINRLAAAPRLPGL